MKRIFGPVFLVMTAAMFFVACGESGEKTSSSTTEKDAKPAFDLVAARKAIESVNAEFGARVAKSDSAGIANLYSSDAKVMGANMPVVTGKAGIQSAFAGMLSMGIGGASLTTIEVWGNESLLSEEGTYSLTDKAGKELDKGKYIVLWKMEDGKWKLFRDCFNSDLPCPPPAK
jgi:ketosteroid isomerase-like protein